MCGTIEDEIELIEGYQRNVPLGRGLVGWPADLRAGLAQAMFSED
jgi:hypothetical protein